MTRAPTPETRPMAKPLPSESPSPMAPRASDLMGKKVDRNVTPVDPPQTLPIPPATSQRAQGPMTAGLVDDNERWSDYLDYRQRKGNFVVRERDVTQRIIIEVRDAQGRPVHDAVVEAGGVQLRTDSAGRALFHPYANGAQQDSRWTVVASKHGASSRAIAKIGQPNNLRITLPRADVAAAPQLDLLFLIDTTGSMADEIDRLRNTMDVIVKDIAKASAEFKTMPDIRYGLVHYRDRGDEYIVRSHAFTASLRTLRKDLACLRAAGGGDEPESLNAALNTTVHQMAWRERDAVRMVILIADAPPHLDYADETFDYAQDMGHAAAKGIKIFPIGASGLNAQGEYIFRQMAQFTGGKFVFLTYQNRNRPGVAPGVETTHDVQNYSVENLDRLVVRLVTDELRPLMN